MHMHTSYHSMNTTCVRARTETRHLPGLGGDCRRGIDWLVELKSTNVKNRLSVLSTYERTTVLVASLSRTLALCNEDQFNNPRPDIIRSSQGRALLPTTSE